MHARCHRYAEVPDDALHPPNQAIALEEVRGDAAILRLLTTTTTAATDVHEQPPPQKRQRKKGKRSGANGDSNGDSNNRELAYRPIGIRDDYFSWRDRGFAREV